MIQISFSVTHISAHRYEYSVCLTQASSETHLLSLSLLCFQIHIIDFDDENNIINKNVLLHQAGEIWHIGASPADKAVLTTCYNKSESYCFRLSLTPVTALLDIMLLHFLFFLFFMNFFFFLCLFLLLLTFLFFFSHFVCVAHLKTQCSLVKNHNR